MEFLLTLRDFFHSTQLPVAFFFPRSPFDPRFTQCYLHLLPLDDRSILGRHTIRISVISLTYVSYPISYFGCEETKPTKLGGSLVVLNIPYHVWRTLTDEGHVHDYATLVCSTNRAEIILIYLYNSRRKKKNPIGQYGSNSSSVEWLSVKSRRIYSADRRKEKSLLWNKEEGQSSLHRQKLADPASLYWRFLCMRILELILFDRVQTFD